MIHNLHKSKLNIKEVASFYLKHSPWFLLFYIVDKIYKEIFIATQHSAKLKQSPEPSDNAAGSLSGTLEPWTAPELTKGLWAVLSHTQALMDQVGKGDEAKPIWAPFQMASTSVKIFEEYI